MKLHHKTLIWISGFVWLAVGLGLFSLGVHFFSKVVSSGALFQSSPHFSIARLFGRFVNQPIEGVLLCMASALLIGYIKARTAFAKAAKRQVARINGLDNPASLFQLYGKGYYFLIALMMSLGFLMRFLPITLDTRAFIDMTVGFALMQGAMHFFRAAVQHGITL